MKVHKVPQLGETLPYASERLKNSKFLHERIGRPVQQGREDQYTQGRGLATRSSWGLQSLDGFFGQKGLERLITKLSADVAM
ncbi:MAG: hypothetical protein KC592_08860 [Nitrospira sp.]|nr:hypothetical protein [Nitrospira sp.]MCW5784865.1 hypothetical protein [Nitrospirales bacterium]